MARKKVNLPYYRTAEGRLFTVRQAADMLSCSTSWVYKLVEDGRLKAFRIGSRKGIRVSEGSLCEYVTVLASLH